LSRNLQIAELLREIGARHGFALQFPGRVLPWLPGAAKFGIERPRRKSWCESWAGKLVST